MLYLDEHDPRRKVWEACESPIEQLLCTAMFSLLGCKAMTHNCFDRSMLPQMGDDLASEPAAYLFSQQPIGRYRVDFLLVAINPRRRSARFIIIECDGKAFHSSDDQRKADAKRDAEINAFGYTVMHITGSDLRVDMPRVLDSIVDWLSKSGVEVKDTTEASSLLRLVTAGSQDVRAARQRARDAIWAKEAEEEAARERQAECP